MGNYLTVAEELQPVADSAKSWYENSGFKVTIENRKRTDCPFLATLECKRLQTTVLVDVQAGVPDKQTLMEWISYCRAQGSDVRYTVALNKQSYPVKLLIPVKKLGIGILLLDSDFNVHEESSAQDLSVNLSLPTLQRYSTRVRELLGPSWDVLKNGDFVQGFEDACVAFEGEAKKYLARHVGSRIHIVTTTGVRKDPTKTQIRRGTMGDLADFFARIDVANHNDSSIAKILKELRPTRNQAAHNRRDGRSLASIKRKGPGLLWKIAQGTELSLK